MGKRDLPSPVSQAVVQFAKIKIAERAGNDDSSIYLDKEQLTDPRRVN